jgi:hypothetical protein
MPGGVAGESGHSLPYADCPAPVFPPLRVAPDDGRSGLVTPPDGLFTHNLRGRIVTKAYSHGAHSESFVNL